MWTDTSHSASWCPTCLLCVGVREHSNLTSMSNCGASILSLYSHEYTSSCLGKHDITSKQQKNKNYFWTESSWDPMKARGNTRCWSSVFFYSGQLLVAYDPQDNWFCLHALNLLFFISFFFRVV